MSGYTSNVNEGDVFWNQQLPQEMPSPNQYYETDFANFQQLDFQSFAETQETANMFSPAYQSAQGNSIMEPQPMFPNDFNTGTDFDEPPLLEELEIYPDRILEKILAVLNPFRAHSLADDSDFLVRDADLAGPITFCVLLALTLLLSGSNAHFGYIYGLSMASCAMMYFLLSLMTITNSVFTFTNVSSILGYCLLPIVWLAVVGVFITFYGMLEVIMAGLAVMWSSLSASRLFTAMSGDNDQRPLIAYPCALVYGAFALLVVF